ncbi:glycine betaine/L-proline ABC transporter ATP-binding protein ProV [uncultured Desulfuromonas sp.]|uniref:glycine betaine/L-proline ABC transporter ATP-binding protein ProV n=1 Tax=uncultured Desulfuromonas sp. TaxID=181013 RepID=UPI0026193D20|nr:glycine betaine/L-proline ABC transporter ATP-binding protein ProV [uncultured Desulfuromonas sp.]
MPTKIKVENLYKIFGPQPKKALKMLGDGLDKDQIHERTGMTVGVQDAGFEIQEGEIFVVMGLSGSGKSTLVRMLNRLIKPSSGHVFFDGQDVATMPDEDLIQLRRKKMSMVFQSFALMPHMTVLENAAFGLEMAGVDRKVRLERAAAALEQVGLEAYRDSRPDELSGGMQQRVGLARSLAVDPEVLLMDEAFSALDPLIRCEMQDELLKLQTRKKRTIVFISHDLDEAMRIGDRIAIMEGGRVVQVGTPEEILQHPANDYVEAFFRGVDPTNILTAGDIARKTQVTLIRHPGEGPRASLQRLISHDRDYGYVLDADKKLLGLVSADSIRELIDTASQSKDITRAFIDEARPVRASDSMQEILPEVTAKPWPVPVLDDADCYLGVISKNIFLRTLQRGQD